VGITILCLFAKPFAAEDLPVRRVLVGPPGIRIVIVSVTTAITRGEVILDGRLRRDPSKPADRMPDIGRVNGASSAEGVELIPVAGEAFVKKHIEVLLGHRVGGVVIEQVPPQGDIGSGGRDQIPAPLRPPDTTP